jgi:hypothetical protein
VAAVRFEIPTHKIAPGQSKKPPFRLNPRICDKLLRPGMEEVMMILKLAVLTCVFYLGISVFMQAAVYGLVFWKGNVLLLYVRWMWGAVFAVVWLAAFSLAWHFFYAGIRARHPSL